MSFKNSYLGQLRSIVGHRPLIVPGARVFILNQEDQLLMMKRKDMDVWGVPGGSTELGESVLDCARRETREEAGLEIGELELWGVSTNYKNEKLEYPNGDIIQSFSVMFYGREYDEVASFQGDETIEIGWFPLKQLPNPLLSVEETAIGRFIEFLESGKILVD